MSWAQLGTNWNSLGSLWAASGTLLGDSWALLGSSWRTLGSSWKALGALWGAVLANLAKISIFPRFYPSPGQSTPLRDCGKGASHFQKILLKCETVSKIRVWPGPQLIEPSVLGDFPSEIPLSVLQHASGCDKHSRRICIILVVCTSSQC